MVIKRSSSTEVARQIDALLTADPVAREAAAARLAILGSRALERLAATLPGLRSEVHLLAVLDVLERIGDPRSAPTVEPLLQDGREAVVTAALGIVRRALQATDASSAARATDVLVEIAIDRTRPNTVRRAALEALEDLPDDVVAPLRRTLSLPPAMPASGIAGVGPAGDDTAQAMLVSWAEGRTDPASTEEARRVVVEAAPAAPLALLHRLVQRLRALESQTPGPDGGTAWRNLRGAVHQQLAERGSRVALYDLRETVERQPEALTVTMLGALAALGDASCLEPVADAWAGTSNDWLRAQLRDTFHRIVTRESLTRRHAALRRVAARHPGLAAGVSTPLRTRPSPPTARRT